MQSWQVVPAERQKHNGRSNKQSQGCTITEYVQQRRMSQAEHLLIDTDFTMGQIAEMIGYSTSSRFAELCHLLVNEPFFFLRDIKFHLNAPLPVCHAPPPFLIRVWDIPASIFHFRARDLKIRKIASGYSLAVLAIETLPLFFPLLILQFGTEILAVRKRYIV